ncbi:MAG: hypothetical protein GKR89_13650 [Candidatus Latescibacteria bacterium]|nr:hypothetical protein [Candidatus Latescibacterota bacterium]
MPLAMKTMTDYLVAFGAADIAHTEKTYLGHAIGVYRSMKAWQANDELCRAAMFHSIYGTEGFQDLTLPVARRGELRYLIGAPAELLVYANCAMDRASFHALVEQDLQRYSLVDRLNGGTIDLSSAQYEDLLRLHLCDFLEQVERSGAWNAQRHSFAAMARRLGQPALGTYQTTFDREPKTN